MKTVSSAKTISSVATAEGLERLTDDPCPRCGAKVPRVFVHGHYQCQSCRSNIDDCCQGEVYET